MLLYALELSDKIENETKLSKSPQRVTYELEFEIKSSILTGLHDQEYLSFHSFIHGSQCQLFLFFEPHSL
jgi:hypothetical protein